jgi:hypothetical protein
MSGFGLLALAAVAACAPKPAAVNAAQSVPETPRDYRPAPELQGGGMTADGRLELQGSALPNATVRLQSPDGAKQLATADDQGVWSVVLSPSPQPRLLSLAMSDNGQVVQALGYLFLAPDGAVARLRSGGGTQASARGQTGLAALALDYDNQRAATLSGMAGPRETVTVRVDGVERGQATANGEGRFVVPLQPLPAGAHLFDLLSTTQEAHFSAIINAPAALGRATYAAQRLGRGWRVDWMTPGGGEQTTLILAPSGQGA